MQNSKFEEVVHFPKSLLGNQTFEQECMKRLGLGYLSTWRPSPNSPLLVWDWTWTLPLVTSQQFCSDENLSIVLTTFGVAWVTLVAGKRISALDAHWRVNAK